MYETFFAEEPRATGWIQCDALGQPVMIEYGYQQSFRYLLCFTNQEYIDYLQSNKRRALIHLINYNSKQAPSIGDIEVSCAIPDGRPAGAIGFYSAASDGHESLKFQMQGSNAVFTIPSIDAYCMVAVSY
jgi:hypothetical protein